MTAVFILYQARKFAFFLKEMYLLIEYHRNLDISITNNKKKPKHKFYNIYKLDDKHISVLKLHVSLLIFVESGSSSMKLHVIVSHYHSVINPSVSDSLDIGFCI